MFRAQNRNSGEFVALKRRKGALDEAKDRMRREIEIQSSINHPNVMPILDYDRDEYQWFTMPLAEYSCDTLSLPIEFFFGRRRNRHARVMSEQQLLRRYIQITAE